MRYERLGEGCLIVQGLGSPARAAAEIANIPGVDEAVAAFNQLAVYFEPGSDIPSQVRSLLEAAGLWSGTENGATFNQAGGQSHTVPAVYDGPDLAESAARLGLSVDQLAGLHSSHTYTVEAIGFCPGFPYMAGLPTALQGLPRRSSPRTQVDPGSIAIVGDQACIYPLARPGGWNIIARTPLTLVDPDDSYFPLNVGDTVHFQRVDAAEFDRLVGERL